KAGDLRAVDAAERFDVRSAAGTRAGDDVGHAIAIDIAGRDIDAAAEASAIGEETIDEVGQPCRGEQVAGPIEDADVRPAAGPSRGDDFRVAVAVKIGCGDSHSAAEGLAIGEEVQ